jgi:hypothetical protein
LILFLSSYLLVGVYVDRWLTWLSPFLLNQYDVHDQRFLRRVSANQERLLLKFSDGRYFVAVPLLSSRQHAHDSHGAKGRS